jgi:uncharacterized protein with HEPN domain
MSKRNILLLLDDILKSIQKIQKYINGKTYNDFIADDLLIDAVIRNLEVIGEATKSIPISFRKKYPAVEWKKIAGLRDILIHEYFGIDYELLWDIVKNKIPELNYQITKIVEELKNKE